jgi:hypothetical protein
MLQSVDQQCAQTPFLKDAAILYNIYIPQPKFSLPSSASGFG